MSTQWWQEERGSGQVHSKVVSYVSEVERVQSDVFDRFVKLAFLYDPNDSKHFDIGRRESMVEENVVANCVDTVTAIVAAQGVRARFITEDGDWSVQRRAKKLELYADALDKTYDIHAKAVRGFKDGALKGNGIIKVSTTPFDEIVVERVMVDDIIVDSAESRTDKPLQMHYRRMVNKEVLKARFPKFEKEIDNACDQVGGPRYWADYRPIDRHEVVVIESWRLPIGRKGYPQYVPGRHTICVDGADLLDEEYHEDFYPFAVFRWSERDTGWYGIGLAERIAGHQRTLNKMSWQIDRQLDQLAVPTTYVRLADMNIAVKTTNRAGTIVPYRAEVPKTVIPPAVSGETYARHGAVKSAAYEDSGVSRMAASAAKPAGLDSGIALREYRDQTTQRFVPQEKGFEKFKLDIIWLVLHCAKKLGKKAPVIYKRDRFGTRKLNWSKVDLGEARVQIQASSDISKTPAGRLQLVLEWAQAGVISQDEARRLLGHPDLERSMSLYNAALEDIERCVELVLDGEVLMPEPYQNLQMGVWKFQQHYLKALADGAPEEVLEGLRQWITQASYMLDSNAPPPPPMGAPPLPQAGAEAPPELPTELPVEGLEGF